MSVAEVEPLWTVEDVAVFLGVPKTTLYEWRYRNRGPRAFRVGKHLRYRPADVNRWLETQGESGRGGSL